VHGCTHPNNSIIKFKIIVFKLIFATPLLNSFGLFSHALDFLEGVVHLIFAITLCTIPHKSVAKHITALHRKMLSPVGIFTLLSLPS
jgi:hypothetical protein